MPSAERESEANHLAYLAQNLNTDIKELTYIDLCLHHYVDAGCKLKCLRYTHSSNAFMTFP